jgi:pimeloyl-ACP methyl ester carboxylesterase
MARTGLHAVLAITFLFLAACGTEDRSVSETKVVTGGAGEIRFGYADSNGVKIHYAEAGEGPLVVMIHGFPDFWYTWRHQMDGLKDRYRVVAIDQRGYNRSDRPEGVENYDLTLLVGDVLAVIGHLGEEKATIVGHDWGGGVAWSVAAYAPESVDNLIILNLPHPNGIAQATRNNAEALAGTNYTQKFREGSPDDPDIFFGYPMTPQTLSGWVTDEAAKARYVEAFERSDFTAMLNYYKQNYPDTSKGDGAVFRALPDITSPTLVFHGLDDKALHSDGLNNTWDWVKSDLTIVTIPGAGHFVQQDASEFVTRTMRSWLDARQD